MRQTEKQKADFCDGVARGLKPEEAAQSAGTTRTTVYRWKLEDPDFLAAWEEADARAIETVESTLFSIATDKLHPSVLGAVCFFLKSRKADVYQPKRHITLAGDPNAPLPGQVWIYPKKEEDV